jgi:hypothetical protein
MKPVDEYFEKMMKRQFDRGDKALLLYAIYTCLESGRPLPEWVRVAFSNAYESAMGDEIKSWDDAFGKPHPKGMHVDKERRHLVFRNEIKRRVEESKTIDEKLFAKIGRDLGIGGSTTVKNIYYGISKKN